MNNIAEQLTEHQKQMIAIANENARLLSNLKICRAVMREHGLGMKYPGATQENEDRVAEASRDSGTFFALQATAFHNAGESEAWKTKVKKIYEWLTINHPKILQEMPGFDATMEITLDVRKFLEKQ